MTLPGSGPISLGNLKNEFGGNASPKLSDYYRNGAFNSSWSETVKTSGAISLSEFKNLSKPYTPKSNNVDIYHEYIRGTPIDWRTPTLMVSGDTNNATSITFTNLAQFLTGTPNNYTFQFRGINDTIFPANTNGTNYPVMFDNTLAYTLSCNLDGSIMIKPGGEYLTTGSYTRDFTFVYIDNYGTRLSKTVTITYSVENR